MNQQQWMLVRAYWPAVALFGLALLMTVPLDSLRDSSLATSMVSAPYWVPVTLVGGALLLFSAASYRLWRWELGEGPSCVTCGGPLGHEHEGRANRGGAVARLGICRRESNAVVRSISIALRY
jgi:hypothetical protein